MPCLLYACYGLTRQVVIYRPHPPAPLQRGEGSEMPCLLYGCYGLTRQLVNSLTTQFHVNISTREPAFFCPLFSKDFSIMAAIFSTNRAPRRK